MFPSAKKTSKGGHLSCSLEKFQQSDKTWRLWYKKIPEEKIALSDLPADWHVAVSVAHFLGLLRFSIILQDFLPHKAEREQTTILLWDANLSVIHLIETLVVLISFSPGRKEGRKGVTAVLETSVHEMIELVSIFKVHFSKRLSVWSSFPCHHWQYSHCFQWKQGESFRANTTNSTDLSYQNKKIEMSLNAKQDLPI